MTAAEDDYRRGFHDGELGRCEARGSDSYASGWRVGATFASQPTEPTKVDATPRTVEIADVLAEIPRDLWTPGVH
jgi:hypothetical protein